MNCIDEICKRASFVNGNEYRFDGRTRSGGEYPSGSFAGIGQDLPPIVGEFAQLIYDRFYVRPQDLSPPYVRDQSLCLEFIRELARAQDNDTTTSSGWTVSSKNGTSLVVVRDGRALELVQDGNLIEGQQTEVRLPGLVASPKVDFAFFSGALDLPSKSVAQRTRFYLHPWMGGVVAIVAALTAQLNRRGIPFRLKTLADPQKYGRADAMVLYVETNCFTDTREALGEVWSVLAPRLRPSIPAFTLGIAPGLALADDPAESESFGVKRSGQVAKGLWLAYCRGSEDVAAVVRRTLEDEGVAPDRLHRDRDDHEFY